MDILYIAYTDDPPPLPPLENKESAEELVNTFTLFSSFLSLIFLIFLNVISVGWAHLKWVKVAACSMQLVGLTRTAMKILGIYFSYKMNLMHQKNYCQAITNIHGVIKLWKMGNLSIKRKIVVFKILPIFKLVYMAFLAVIPNHIIDEVAKIQKCFILNDSSPKNKHVALRMEFRVGGLNDVGMRFKFSYFSVLG